MNTWILISNFHYFFSLILIYLLSIIQISDRKLLLEYMIGCVKVGSHVACLFSLYLSYTQRDSKQRHIIFYIQKAYFYHIMCECDWFEIETLLFLTIYLRSLEIITYTHELPPSWLNLINYVYTSTTLYQYVRDIFFYFILPYIK